MGVFRTCDRCADEEALERARVLFVGRHMQVEACHIDYPLGELTAYAGHS